MTKHSLHKYLAPLLLAFLFVAPGNGHARRPPGNNAARAVLNASATAFKASAPITCMLQDRAGNYWFGTHSDGLYRYDGQSMTRFSMKDGLSSNQIKKIQEDRLGNLWFGTGGGINRFDGRKFATFPDSADLQASHSAGREWKAGPDDLWFEVSGGAYRYDGTSFNYLALPDTYKATNPSQAPSGPLTPFTVYSIFKDRTGNLWFGTQSLGVCRYDGSSFTWFNAMGLSGPAVLAIFQDTAGNLWFGNNGAGVFRYDGKSLTNFTDEKGLGNPDFFKTSSVAAKPGAGTLARIYVIAEDKTGNIWFGTIDAGVWRYDGSSLTNFTKKDGLDSDAIQSVYQDRSENLLVGTDAGSVYIFKNNAFVSFAMNNHDGR